MKFNLYRIEHAEDYTRGVLTLESVPIWTTLELPWKANQRSISCIPAGEYELIRWPSPKFGQVLMVRAVPNRDGILIHAGNTAKDTQGCILVGEIFIHAGIAQSKDGLRRLLMTAGPVGDLRLKIH